MRPERKASGAMGNMPGKGIFQKKSRKREERNENQANGIAACLLRSVLHAGGMREEGTADGDGISAVQPDDRLVLESYPVQRDI